MSMTETECDFVPQHFSVLDEFDVILTGTDDDQEDCLLLIDLIQNIKPDEGVELSDVTSWIGVVHLEVHVSVSLLHSKVEAGIRGTMHGILFIPSLFHE
jgi:hypothetical protein